MGEPDRPMALAWWPRDRRELCTAKQSAASGGPSPHEISHGRGPRSSSVSHASIRTMAVPGARGRRNSSISRFVRRRSRAISQEMRVQGRRQSLHSDTVSRIFTSHCMLKRCKHETKDLDWLARGSQAGCLAAVGIRRAFPTRGSSRPRIRVHASTSTKSHQRRLAKNINVHAWMTRINRHGVSGIMREGATTSTRPKIGHNIDT